jgi:hypothetical protein
MLCLGQDNISQIYLTYPTQDPKLPLVKDVVPGKYFRAIVGRRDRDNSRAVHLSPASCSSWPSSQNSASRLVITPHLFLQQLIGSVSANEKGSCPPMLFKQLAIHFPDPSTMVNFLSHKSLIPDTRKMRKELLQYIS